MTAEIALPLRVVKLGGSLLSNTDLANLFCGWVASQPVAIQIIVCGGGEIVDALRGYAKLWSLSDEFSHDVAIELTTAMSQIFAEILQVPVCSSWQELSSLVNLSKSNASPLTIVFDYSRWNVATQELEKSWRITSDSVAAVVAIQIEADELVLPKSCSIPAQADIDLLRTQGIVDDAFADFTPLLASWRIEPLQ